MIRATVVGPVWATKRIDGFPAGALLEVRRDHTDQRYVALDHLGCGPGDRVLVALGSAVARCLPGAVPADALVIGILDDQGTG
ncbi:MULTISPECIES: EutN/CcmL family microcompartment protein [unclassified Gordonia (in: high G+C Gram-positive bacteria)]|uniref:EutN/CcmL family microcompartment protein n=1 Tax=unclassified Gordonia (in: high G+C Gram-positive bacteria) TaxID=2657482 RepID=UPI001FFE6DCA|nr:MULTISPECIES: EutN/CcmL family microcompartment protein [unclassified Gordonia (in: high G+C Gram-positive bacteria)]UQE74938.1 ethanolamine utilization protein EutN [Gordonia sp. PP30]